MVPPSARSCSPIKVLLSIESSSLRASSDDGTGVLPRLTTYLGPRTEAAGLTSRMPPVVRYSKGLTNGGQVLFDRRLAGLGSELLNKTSHVSAEILGAI